MLNFCGVCGVFCACGRNISRISRSLAIKERLRKEGRMQQDALSALWSAKPFPLTGSRRAAPSSAIHSSFLLSTAREQRSTLEHPVSARTLLALQMCPPACRNERTRSEQGSERAGRGQRRADQRPQHTLTSEQANARMQYI